MSLFICERCGSGNLLFREWRDENGAEGFIKHCSVECCENHTYCRDCDDYVNSIDTLNDTGDRSYRFYVDCLWSLNENKT